MDNLIQVLVFLFIIYAIISPALKKKPPQNTNRPHANRFPGEGRQKQSAPPTNSDVFEELFGLKLPKTNDQIPKPTYKSDYEDIKTVDYDTDIKTDYKNLEIVSTMPNVDYDKIPFNATMPEDILEQKDVVSPVSFVNLNAKAVEVKKMFSEMNSLRDIILASEIINKPKALRR